MNLGLGNPLLLLSSLVGVGSKIAVPFIEKEMAGKSSREDAERAELARLQAELDRKRRGNLFVIGGLTAAALLAVYLIVKK